MIYKVSWILSCSGNSLFLASVTNNKSLKTENSNFDDDKDNPSETQGAFSK